MRAGGLSPRITTLLKDGYDAADIPDTLKHDIAGIDVRYTRHASNIARTAMVWKETVTKSQLNRSLDIFMMIRSVSHFKDDVKSINETVKRFNQFFFAQPHLQVSGKTTMRIKNIMNDETTPQDAKEEMQDAIQKFGWEGGPWSNEKCDLDGFYIGSLTRETSHSDWSKLFIATQRSQRQAIYWNHLKHSKGQPQDSLSFQKMINRLVAASNLCEHVLAPAGVLPPLIDSFLEGVLDGYHQASLDEFQKMKLPDDFRIAQAREVLGNRLSFLETIINQNTSAQLGLSATAIAAMEKLEASKKQDSWKNQVLRDVDNYVRMNDAYRGNKTSYQEAETAHKQDSDENAKRAMECLFYGKQKDSDVCAGGRFDFQVVPTDDFPSKFVPALNHFIVQCVQSQAAREIAVTDADIGLVLIVDFASVGSLSEMQLKHIKQAQAVLLSGPYDIATVGFYPEKPGSYTQFKRSPAEQLAMQKEVAAAPGTTAKPEEDDVDLLTDDLATLPVIPADSQTKKTARELRAKLCLDKANIDAVLGRGDLDAWYYETFSLRIAAHNAALRDARDGFVLLPLAVKEWMHAGIVKGAFAEELPRNDCWVKVSRQEAKRARAENKITMITGGGYRYQKGTRAEKMILNEFLRGAASTKKFLTYK